MSPTADAPRTSGRTAADGDLPLRIAFLTYRGKPHVGGQGVYTRHLTKALVDLGHEVEVLSGQPYPIVDPRVPLIDLPSLDIYNDQFPMRIPGPWEIKSMGDLIEVGSFMGGSFPEPLAFSVRAFQHLRRRVNEFDLVQDNQCLGYGLLAMERIGLPVLARRESSPALVAAIIERLPDHRGTILPDDVEQAFRSHRGNVRDTLAVELSEARSQMSLTPRATA
jgi:glycosyltransferase involved in cell wall biosynthesis